MTKVEEEKVLIPEEQEVADAKALEEKQALEAKEEADARAKAEQEAADEAAKEAEEEQRALEADAKKKAKDTAKDAKKTVGENGVAQGSAEGSAIAAAIAEGLKNVTAEKNFVVAADDSVLPRFAVVKNADGEVMIRESATGHLSKVQLESLEEKESSIQNQEVEEV